MFGMKNTGLFGSRMGGRTMSFADWKDRTAGFKKINVRGVAGNFFPGLKKQAMELPVGAGLEVVQTFEPIPLYAVMEQLGYE